MLEVRFRNGRSLGRVEENFAAQLSPGDTFAFAGTSLEVEQLRDMEIIVRASKMSSDQIIICNLSGRGDKDVAQVAERVEL